MGSMCRVIICYARGAQFSKPWWFSSRAYSEWCRQSDSPNSVYSVTFTVANVVATVEVRAKSMEPGVCGVEFSTNFNDQIVFLAPPAIWSPWTFLASHTGTATYKVSADVQCDTDALMEVRFFEK